MDKVPFYYEIRFSCFSFNENDERENEFFTKKFESNNLLTSRDLAFSAFKEYQNFLLSTGRIKKNQYGNIIIDQPTGIKSEIENIDNKFYKLADINDMANINYLEEKQKEFWEDISLYMIFDDLEFYKKVELKIFEEQHSNDDYLNSHNEYLLHKISSTLFDPQNMLDNLEMREYEAYKLLNIDVSDIIETVYYFGTDYFESGEDEEDGAKRTILGSPYNWGKIEDVEGINKPELSNDSSIKESINAPRIEDVILDIIEKGEGKQLEFKSTFLYKNNKESNHISIYKKYIVAKTINSFMNSSGGALLIGVNDNGQITGIDRDLSVFEEENKKDKLLLEIDSMISYFLGKECFPLIDSNIISLNNREIILIRIKSSSIPKFVRNKVSGVFIKEFFVRATASCQNHRSYLVLF